ncbi:hypothetical protein PG997_002724 [Apiospora hydei]|uniref:Uncharacterized protein n=1 Tax=Apiospora hydei TaxID=1337664 RepID=A0ABR1WXB3_9PEZI
MTTDPGSAPTKTTSRGAGPLTTVFHTPEFCAPDRWTEIGTPALSSSICMPDNWMQYFGNKAGMYSPGICPDGYTEGCALPTALPSVESDTPLYGGPLLAGETARMCCPTGYTCYTGPQTEPEKPYSRCISAAHSSRTYVESHVTHTSRNMAYLIQVRWQESDLSILETDPTMPGSTFSGPTATATATPNPGDDDGAGHMPFHIILAIAIALLLFLILLGIVAWLVWRRHFWKHQVIHRELASTPDLRKGGEAHFDHSAAGLASREEPTPLLDRPTPAYSRLTTSSYVVSPLTPATSEMEADMLPSIHEAPADAQPRMELEAREEVQELPAMSFAVELEGSTPADLIQPPPPRTPSRQQHQEEGAYSTSKSDGDAVGDEKSPGGATRRRKSLGTNRLTQANPPPPYSDNS